MNNVSDFVNSVFGNINHKQNMSFFHWLLESFQLNIWCAAPDKKSWYQTAIDTTNKKKNQNNAYFQLHATKLKIKMKKYIILMNISLNEDFLSLEIDNFAQI